MEEIQPSEQDIKHPRRSKLFVYYKHIPSGKTEDMPYKDWVRLKSDKGRAKDFELIRYVNPGGVGKIAYNPDKVTSPPIEDDQLQCPLCGKVVEDEAKLAAHKTLKHGVSSQITGADKEQVNPESLPGTSKANGKKK